MSLLPKLRHFNPYRGKVAFCNTLLKAKGPTICIKDIATSTHTGHVPLHECDEYYLIINLILVACSAFSTFNNGVIRV
jgi:hypothetical protein